MLFAKLDHLLRETFIRSGDFAVAVVGIDAFADDADLGAFDSHRNMAVKDLDPAPVIVADRLLSRLCEICVFRDERQNDTVYTELRVDLFLHFADRSGKLGHSFQGKVVRLYWDDHRIGSGESVDGNHSETRHTVKQNVVISAFHAVNAEPAAEGAAEQEKNVSAATEEKLPKWWNDIGIGLYTDKQLEPETFIVTQGQCKGKNWTVKYLYDFNYKSCWYFATRDLENAPSEEFTKQVYACRRAIRKYGIKTEEKTA